MLGRERITSMGPGTMVIDPIYNRLFVSNFNANSVSVFDLSVGGGIQIAEIQSMSSKSLRHGIDTDGNHLVVSNYTGMSLKMLLIAHWRSSMSIRTPTPHIANTGGEPMIWLLFGYGCTQNLPYNALFDGPAASTIVPAESGMWEQPLGFIANRRSGTVVPLDLQHNSPFSDQLTAPFMRPRGVAMGQMRQIADPMSMSRVQINSLYMYWISTASHW